MALRLVENKTASDNPVKKYCSPNKTMNPSSEPILTIAAYPTLVDSLAWSFALTMADIVRGIIEITISCNPKIPSWNLGKNKSTKVGATKITIIATKPEPSTAR